MFARKQSPVLFVLLALGMCTAGRDLLAQPTDFLRRFDRNNNGMLDPNEVEGRFGDFLKRMAENNPRIDFSRPVPIDRLTQEFQRMREERMRSGGGGPGGGFAGRGGPGGGFAGRGGPGGGFAGRGGPGGGSAGRGGPGGGPPGGRTDRGRSSSDRSNSTYASRTIEVEPLVPGFGVDTEMTPPPGFGAEADLFTIEITDQDRREAERAFGYYDRNHDRKIDSEEMKRSRYGSDLPLFDRNRDGFITLNEMEYRYAQRRVNNEGGSSTAAKDSGKSSNKEDVPEAGWRKKRDDDRKSYRQQTPIAGTQEGLPDWFPRDDADGDGQVAMAEFSVSWSDSVIDDFNQFDLNQDGIITPQECLKAGANGAVRGGSIGASSSASSDSSSADSGTSSGESGSSSSSPSAGASTASTRPSPAPTTSVKIDPRYLKYYQSLVAKYDKNGDKVLVHDEWVSMSKDPAAADVDGNGRITVEEYATWSMKRQ